MTTQERILHLANLENGILINLIMDNNPSAVANNVMGLTGAKGELTKEDVLNVWEQYHSQGQQAKAWSIFDVPYLPGNGITPEDDAAIQTLINLSKSAPRIQKYGTNGGPAGEATQNGGGFDLGSLLNSLVNNASGIIGAVTGAVNGGGSTPSPQPQNQPAASPAPDNTSKAPY